MKYKTFPGVILASVCGHHYLVSARDTIEVNETAAFCWEKLRDGAEISDLTRALEDCYETEDREVFRKDIQMLVKSLSARHLLMRYPL